MDRLTARGDLHKARNNRIRVDKSVNYFDEEGFMCSFVVSMKILFFFSFFAGKVEVLCTNEVVA